MRYLLGGTMILIGGVFGVGRVMNWLTWSSKQWRLYTRELTSGGILRWLTIEAIAAVFWAGLIVWGWHII